MLAIGRRRWNGENTTQIVLHHHFHSSGHVPLSSLFIECNERNGTIFSSRVLKCSGIYENNTNGMEKTAFENVAFYYKTNLWKILLNLTMY